MDAYFIDSRFIIIGNFVADLGVQITGDELKKIEDSYRSMEEDDLLNFGINEDITMKLFSAILFEKINISIPPAYPKYRSTDEFIEKVIMPARQTRYLVQPPVYSE